MSIKLDCNNSINKVVNNTYKKTCNEVSTNFETTIKKAKTTFFEVYEKKAEDSDFKFLSNAPANVKKAWNATWNSLQPEGRMDLIVGMIELQYMNPKCPNKPIIDNVNGFKDSISSFISDIISMDKSGLSSGHQETHKGVIDALSKLEEELNKYN
ncbi:hypothetical protein HBE96_17595 [Clostridium sp. P21]|uniref:Uncharacterized protein n=1 Tax=Clostridium muellerianum TaxID=2716538 RepID=A0A7Y0EL64_9CLOT|nr:hypothetical protein [Clostridium muellerianum]NMM64435.1 hypothetical protein [Clostridium muellerianum]